MLDKNKKYLLACSYGPDSMALFAMLLKEGYNFDVAFVNYNLRNESVQEEKDIRKFCEKHNVKLFVRSVTQYKAGNIENQCREIRYKFFKELADLNGYDFTLIAHHEDDLLETYLMQKSRKNHVKHFGLAASTNIIGVDIKRPLLNLTKADLLNYCKENQVPYSLDQTNFEDIFLRNRIRHHIVEKLTKNERKKLLKEIEDRNKELNQMFNKIKSIDITDCQELMRLNKFEYLYAINELSHCVCGYSVSKKFADEICRVLLSDKPNVTIRFHDDFAFEKSYDRCQFIRVSNESFTYLIDIPKEFDCDYFYLDFTKDTSSRNVKPSDYPLTIRNVHKNDVYKIKSYLVKVNRLLIDWKMPISLRKRWPVVMNNRGEIIYIPRYQKDFHRDSNCNFYVK